MQRERDTTVVSVATLPTSSGSEEFNPCPGETVSYLGTILQHGDVEVFTLQNSLGCVRGDGYRDGTLTDTTYLTYQLVYGETVDYQGFEAAAGETSSFIFTDINGCDSVVSVIGTVTASQFGYKVDSACADVADGKVEVIDILGGVPPLMFALDGDCISRGFTFSENIAPNDHVLTVFNGNGCDRGKNIE
ncbi:MAG: hypothetical protein R2788_07380 [Saprospiraceae bacterium]